MVWASSGEGSDHASQRQAARDVVIDGKATLDFPKCSLVRARVTVDGPAGADGRLRLRGNWFSPEAKVIRIRGGLGGRRVGAVVPAG